MSLIVKVQTSAAWNDLWKLIQNSSEYFIVEDSELQNLIYFCTFHSLTLFVNKCSRSLKRVCCIKLLFQTLCEYLSFEHWTAKLYLCLLYMPCHSLFDTVLALLNETQVCWLKIFMKNSFKPHLNISYLKMPCLLLFTTAFLVEILYPHLLHNMNLIFMNILFFLHLIYHCWKCWIATNIYFSFAFIALFGNVLTEILLNQT